MYSEPYYCLMTPALMYRVLLITFYLQRTICLSMTLRKMDCLTVILLLNRTLLSLLRGMVSVC